MTLLLTAQLYVCDEMFTIYVTYSFAKESSVTYCTAKSAKTFLTVYTVHCKEITNVKPFVTQYLQFIFKSLYVLSLANFVTVSLETELNELFKKISYSVRSSPHPPAFLVSLPLYLFLQSVGCQQKKICQHIIYLAQY